MSTRKLNQHGFGALVFVSMLLIITAVGFTGYKVVSKSQAKQQSSASSQTTAPATIKSSADLESTSKELDQSNTELDSDLNDSSLDADVNSML